ncbi:MAG: hypothetical protein ACD_87C00144G0001, partial [uncultured bacterium]
MHRILRRVFPDDVCGLFNPLRKQVPQPLPPGDLFHHLQHRLRIAKLQRHAVGVLQIQDAVFETLHGKCDSASRGYGVNAVAIAHLMGFADCGQVIDQQVGTERRERLVFRSAVSGVHPQGADFRLHFFLAADRAVEAAFHTGAILGKKCDRIDLSHVRELAARVISDRQVAHLFEFFHGPSRSIPMKRAILVSSRHEAIQRNDLLFVRNRRWIVSPDDN